MKHKAHMYFWITTILIIVLGFVVYCINGDTNLDINVHDTYLVVSHTHFTILFALLYFILGTAYWVPYKTKLSLNKKLTKVHTVITMMAVPAYCALTAYYAMLYTPDPLTDGANSLNTGILIIFFTVLLIQPLYLVNIVISVIKRKKA
jgi:heme/copper-type cytochrome/quinol oxidase subunit 1